MQLNFVGKNTEVTEALKQFALEKFKTLDKYALQITHGNLVLHIEHLAHIAEASIMVQGTELHARAEANDMYLAITSLVNKLDGQIIKHKEKIIDRHR